MQRIHTKTTLNSETMAVVEDHWYLYDGPIEQTKGGESKAAAAAEAARQKRQDAIAEAQLGMQRDVLSEIKKSVGPYIGGEGLGFTPSGLAAARSQAIQGAGLESADINKRLMTILARRGAVGGNQPVAGSFLSNLGTMEEQLAQMRQGNLLNILGQDEELKRQNRLAAWNAMLGVGTQYTPSPFLEAGSAAGASRQRAAQAADEAQSGFYGALFGGLTGAAGSFLGGPAFGKGGKFGG